MITITIQVSHSGAAHGPFTMERRELHLHEVCQAAIERGWVVEDRGARWTLFNLSTGESTSRDIAPIDVMHAIDTAKELIEWDRVYKNNLPVECRRCGCQTPAQELSSLGLCESCDVLERSTQNLACFV